MVTFATDRKIWAIIIVNTTFQMSLGIALLIINIDVLEFIDRADLNFSILFLHWLKKLT